MKFLVGLLLGIAIAGGIAYFLNRAPNPFVNKGIMTEASGSVAAQGSNSAPMLLAPGTRMQQAAPQNPATKPTASTPTYDFYDVLQGKKDINTRQAASAAAPITKGFIVQVGAFSNQDSANDMKAKMALLGYSTKIKTIQEDDKVINKVTMGPFMDINKAQSIIDQLKQQDIDATIINLNP